MLFVFRGVRNLQVILAIVSMALALACVLLLKRFTDGGSALLLVLAIVTGVVFLWGFATTVRIPTSFVAIADARTRFRFAGFVDTVIDNRDILGARVIDHSWLGGLGVRSNFRGTVTLASAGGPACELTLAQPIRIWLIPRVLPIKARVLRLSVRNPDKMAAHFNELAKTSRPARETGRAASSRRR